MQTHEVIQREIGEWSRQNFGGQETPYFKVFEEGTIKPGVKRSKEDKPGREVCIVTGNVVALNGLAPLMGVVEEVGELYGAKKPADIMDALGDIAVYLCDYTYREEIVFPTRIDLEPQEKYPPMVGLAVYLGLLHHCHLKRLQRIREMHSATAFTIARQKALNGFVWHLEQVAREATNNADLLTLLNETWTKIVKKRDWKADAAAGGGHAHDGPEHVNDGNATKHGDRGHIDTAGMDKPRA